MGLLGTYFLGKDSLRKPSLQKPPGLLAPLAPIYQELSKDPIQKYSIRFIGTLAWILTRCRV